MTLVPWHRKGKLSVNVADQDNNGRITNCCVITVFEKKKSLIALIG